MNLLIKVFFLGWLVSCSSNPHKFMRGNVVMKMSEKDAHICLGNNEVDVGNSIIFYNNDCNQYDNSIEGLGGLCKLIEIGKGRVESIINSHYSLVKTDGSFQFKEGDLVRVKK
ncbi:MAG: hypothetical protein CME70_11080 [Halobacteriovorax sp.]|nr:hypothetical protein [Halobacteriovorax sp.]